MMPTRRRHRHAAATATFLRARARTQAPQDEFAKSSSSMHRTMTVRSKQALFQLLFYFALFVGTLVAISVTVARYGLFPFQLDSLEWTSAWLSATIVDYYGACLCFCGVVLSSEQSWLIGIAWVIGCCLLGSPVCCAWVLCRLWRGGGTLRLAKLDYSENMND